MGTVALIGYYNYVMFAPYLLPMCVRSSSFPPRIA